MCAPLTVLYNSAAPPSAPSMYNLISAGAAARGGVFECGCHIRPRRPSMTVCVGRQGGLCPGSLGWWVGVCLVVA